MSKRLVFLHLITGVESTQNSKQSKTPIDQFECNCCERLTDNLMLTEDGEGLCPTCMTSYAKEYGKK